MDATRYCIHPAIVLAFLTALTTLAQPTSTEFLSDAPERILSASQSWGELGFDTAAHQPGQAGMPLRLGTNSYAKGLGHHANGSLVIVLDGEFASFDAEVGIHPQASSEGSVVFRVLVDGKKKFDSGVLTQADGARPIHVAVEGAQELVLEANDAGDGITCDVANWANARLTRAAASATRKIEQGLDMAPFARLVTSDPNRTEGCRANRIQEFRAEDLLLETDLPANADGTYTVPQATNGLGCIGLQWLNRRALRELSIRFADLAQMPPVSAVQVQGWFGESAWQGNWQPLGGTNFVSDDRIVFRTNPKAGHDGWLQVQKIRWILPASNKPFAVRSLSALTRSRWQNTKMFVQVENPSKAAHGEIDVYNGEILSEIRNPQSAIRNKTWDLSHPLHLEVRSSLPSSFKSDPTVLQFRLPTGAFGVAVEDVLSNECVYLPDHGLFLAREPLQTSLRAYKAKIAQRKTILQQVREMPDQTFAQAMARTHHDAQKEGPVMLSLACDNSKFVVERSGIIRFPTAAQTSEDWFATAGELRPTFGNGKTEELTRHLDGGWLPIPVITLEQDGLLYTQRTFVAPYDEPSAQPTRLNRRSVCVSEFTVKNLQNKPLPASLALSFLSEPKSRKAMQLTGVPQGFLAQREEKPVALIETTGAAQCQPQVSQGTVAFTGSVPAQESARWIVYLPGTNVKPEEVHSLRGAEALRAAVEAYWKTVLSSALTAELPDRLLNDIIRSSQVRCLIAARNEADGARIAPWIAAMSYGPLESEAHSVIRGMDLMGHTDFAQRGLDFFIHRYNKEGFLTTGYTTFGTGWHLWTLGEHCRLNHDAEWLQHVAPEIRRVAEWIVRQTEKTAHPPPADVSRLLPPHPGPLPRGEGGRSAIVRGNGTPRFLARREMVPPLPKGEGRGEGETAYRPELGLMPPGVLADWNAFAYHFCLNAYYYAALRDAGASLSEIGDPRGPLFLEKAAGLRGSILRAYHWTQAQSPALALNNGAWVPAYPSQVHSPGKLGDFFPGQDAGRSWCYDVEVGAHQLVPAGVLEANSPEVTRMMEHMEDVQFLADGWFDYPSEQNHRDWFNLGGFSKVQPYYTRNGEIYAMRDEVKPFVRSYFNTIAAMLNPEVLTLWEHFHHSGAWDKTHETGYFLQQTRFMLVMEHGDDLWLAPLITSNWLKDGMVIAVTNAPTRFGKVSYRITSHVAKGYIDAVIEPLGFRSPKALVLRLRHPEGKRLQSVTIDGGRHTDFDREKECINIKPAVGPIILRAEYPKGRTL